MVVVEAQSELRNCAALKACGFSEILGSPINPQEICSWHPPATVPFFMDRHSGNRSGGYPHNMAIKRASSLI